MPENIVHLKEGFIPNFEAHNTLLDLFTQAELLGVLTIIGLGAVVFADAARARLDGLTTLLCGLAMFSMFHLIVCHPIFWFAIVLCLVASDAGRRASAPRTWS
jgi:hypothetical protein